MLHRLAPQPGQLVLDVGTGSGYSAALLGHKIGDSHVTSVDVDPYLTDAARTRLAAFGRAPYIATVDATGGLPGSDFARIMATVSARSALADWACALLPGGRIVATIAGTALLFTADMGPDGIARGRIAPDPASFMETRRTDDYPPELSHVFTVARDADGDDVSPVSGPVPDLWQDWPLRYLYELDTPGIETRCATFPDGRSCLWLLGADGSWARIDGAEGKTLAHQGGPRRLWDALDGVRRRWEDAGRFSLDAWTIELGREGGTVVAPDDTWRLQL